jgi:SAM-dependent methyltransferase
MRDPIEARYAAAAKAATNPLACACGDGAQPDRFGRTRYDNNELAGLDNAANASLGCGNPLPVADLRPGDVVLDLGSGAGLDVLLSARRVGPTGMAYGLDMTDEMLALARANATKANADNVEFLKGHIEHIPLPDATVDVIISNCVLNLSTDKATVLREAHRVLKPGGHIGISDVLADEDIDTNARRTAETQVGCVNGTLTRSEYLDLLEHTGFVNADVVFSHPVADGLYSATVKATSAQ